MSKPDDRDVRRRKLMNAVRPGSAPASPPASGWTHETVHLPASHNWKCSPGHLLLIADRGEVQFEYPDGWHVGPGKNGAVCVRDRPHPADECRIQLTIIRTPGVPASAIAALPLTDLLRHAVDAEVGDSPCPGWTRLTEPTAIERPDLRAVWIESSWLDRDNDDRKILSRQLIARAPSTHPLITFDYYESRADDFRPVWHHLVDTLRIASPRSLFGDALN